MKTLITVFTFLYSFSTFSQDCIDPSQYTVAYLNAVSTDHITYPVGTAFMTQGNISFVKPNQISFYQGIMGDTLFYVGGLDIDVSAETCSNKRLTFSCVYLESLFVDGDTIFTSLNPPAIYNGAGFTFEYIDQGTHRDYIITGDFDVAQLRTQTNFIWDACVECVTPGSLSCIDPSQYTVGYLNAVSTDHVTYPVGTAFMTAGYLSFVKPNTISFYQGIMGDTLFYFGGLDMDVTAAPCTNKRLSFSCVYLEGLAVDGDTIFPFLNPPAFYAGAGFTFEYIDQGTHRDYIITGDFDVAHLFTSTNFIWDACLECLAGFDDTANDLPELSVYPNPTDGKITVDVDKPASFALYSLEGTQITTGTLESKTEIDLTIVPDGMYILQVSNQRGSVTQRIVIR